MDQRHALGTSGEDVAARCLERAGLRVVERNFRVGHVEIDLVARRGDLIVFCEVKTRSSDRWGLPAEAVRRTKQLHLRRAAAAWLFQRDAGAVDVRFDVVSVIVRPDGRTDVQHFPDAF